MEIQEWQPAPKLVKLLANTWIFPLKQSLQFLFSVPQYPLHAAAKYFDNCQANNLRSKSASWPDFKLSLSDSSTYSLTVQPVRVFPNKHKMLNVSKMCQVFLSRWWTEFSPSVCGGKKNKLSVWATILRKPPRVKGQTISQSMYLFQSLCTSSLHLLLCSF